MDMKILACQIAVPEIRSFGDKCAHVRRVADAIESRLQSVPDIDLVILPELSVIEYSAGAFEMLDVLAEDLHGFSYQCFADLARKHQCTVAYGFPRISENGYHITHSVVGHQKTPLIYYDKVHIAQLGASAEKPYFSPGNRLTAFEISGFCVAVIICYDFRFPQLTNLISAKFQPDLIIHPVAFPKDSTFKSWHPFVICRAVESQAYFLSLNRAGDGWGDSIFCPPWIDEHIKPVTFGSEEEFKTFAIDSGILDQIRTQYPFRKDRLDDYSVLRE